MKRLLLVGGGHAHLPVLRALADFVSKNLDVKLVTPGPLHTYSGMVPGAVAGHYAVPQAQVDLARLAGRAGVELVLNSVLSFDPAEKIIDLGNGDRIPYDLLSLNLGSLPNYLGVPGAVEYAIAARPFERFLGRWNALLEESKAPRIAIAGAGAGGVELAMAMKHRLREAEVVLFSGENSFSSGVTGRVSRSLERLSIGFRPATPVTAVESGPIVVSRSGREPFHALFWAAGAAAPPLLRQSGLDCDAHGYARVDDTLRSVSHPTVFASGDTASLEGAGVAKSGVYAVRQGAVLAENLKLALLGKDLRRYVPQKESLSLISCGGKYAIASRGRWSAEGSWVWWWKNWLDRRWVARFQ
ncbi:MAG TPA: FAD-dependent oxidoreductase [Burkholderiales bacterium]